MDKTSSPPVDKPHIACETRDEFVGILDRFALSLVLSTRPNLVVCIVGVAPHACAG